MSEALEEKSNAEPLQPSASAGVIENGRYLAPPEDKDGKLWVRTSALVQGAPADLSAIWSDTERIPLWQEQIVRVTRTGERTTHWVMRKVDKDAAQTGHDETIEWDSETLVDEPGRIAWRSIGGELQNAGEVIFELAPGGRGTMVTVLQEFRLGKLASAWQTIVGRNPKQAVIENLRHFKALAETGEIPRIQGQPHGPRGVVAKVKESAYGEKIATPPATNRKAS